MAIKNTFDIGDRPQVTARFTNINGEPVTPTAFTVKVRNPSGVETSHAHSSLIVTTPSDGTIAFEMPYALNAHGAWSVRIVCSSPVQAATEETFQVRSSVFSNP